MKAHLERILKEFATDKKLLLAVSGGMDSMSLFHLLHSTDHPFEVAHCNFQLRGADSDGDQKLIEEMCAKQEVVLHIKAFDTEIISDQQGTGIQETARNLRYEWFESLLEERQLDLITTAHHANDQTETIVMNFLRGSGPAGLSGMQILRSSKFRPLLKVSKEAIAAYAESKEVQYREDASNISTKYRRNRIRLDINPRLEEINPNLVDTLSSQSRVMHEVQEMLSEQLPDLASTYFENSEVDIQKLGSSLYPLLIVGEIFRQDELTRAQLLEILDLCQAQPGAQFAAGRLNIVRDREKLLFSRKDKTDIQPIQFDSIEELKSSDFLVEILDPESAQFKGPNEVWLDADKIHFPLTLRKWEAGDRFQPLGMTGSQKISDLLVQRKISTHEKEEVTVLCMGDQILWIPNHHSDDRFKLTQKTTRALHLGCQ